MRIGHIVYSLSIFFVSIMILPSIVYAQSDEINQTDATIITGEKLNDPIAQDILKKIEQTKKWIAELEEREYEKLKAQNELNEMRAGALERLNHDLKEWEKLWEEYSSINAFEKFVNKKPEFVQGIFWDQFEFKEMKVKAGRAAFKAALYNGESFTDAQDAYRKAAETKRIELIEQNAYFNEKHNLARYQEQILFDYEGKFINSTESQDRLSEIYGDYKNNPTYLDSNPQETFERVNQMESDTECRPGLINVHRITQDDYTCVTEDTALDWITYGIAEMPNVPDTIKIEKIITDIDKVNQRILEINAELEEAQGVLKKSYDIEYYKIELAAKNKEKSITQEYTVIKSLSDDKFTEKMLEARHQLAQDKEEMLDEKQKAMQELYSKNQEKLDEIFREFRDSLDVKIVWDSTQATYQAVKK